MLRRHAMTQRGGITLLFAATMLLLVSATAAAMLQMLLAGRQLAVAGRDREIAFRAAEAALFAAEAELLAAAGGSGDRFGQWPAAGECGRGAQAALCNTAQARTPVWQPWLHGSATDLAIGVPVGSFAGVSEAFLPEAFAGSHTAPRYVAELLDDGPVIDEGRPALPRLRVTAVGFGRSPAVRAVVQSIVQP
ncbi:pilus assembly protein [Cupriavidus sp. P-10]|uniref:pilus assembly protein n=1 Tax=Cupriavidus sp. P-10 TaxID=2027911 RepID=UPI000E2EC05B|nr:pilus assembly protein [Cupriavidus sp. P-10]BDB25128.1 pilus assembly protein [Cupriavidus sp. P-10]